MPNTPGRINIGRVRAAAEVTLGADLSGSIASFGDLRILEGVLPDVNPAWLKDESLRQLVWQRFQDIAGFRSTKGISIKANLLGTGQPLVAGATPTKTTQSKVLEVICGGYSAAAGAAYASAATTTGMTVGAALGANFPAGSIGWIETGNGTGFYNARKITARASDALTWGIALPGAPAAGVRILNSQLIYPTNSPTGTLVFIVEGENREEVYEITGCQGDLSLDWKLGQLVTWASSLAWSTWLKDTEMGTPLGGAALALATYDGGAAVPATAGGIIFTPAAGTALTRPNIVEFSFNPGIKYQQLESFNGVEGKSGFVLTPDEAMVTLKLPFDRTYETARDAGTKYQLLAQAGNTGGRQVALECPCLQLLDVKPVAQGGVRYHEITAKCLMDESTGSLATDLLRAPWRLAFG